MAEKRKAPSYRGLSSLFLLITIFGSILFFSFVVEPAYAFSVAGYATGADARGIAYLDGYLYVSTAGANTVRIFAESAPGTLVQSLTGCTGCTGLLVYDGKVYAAGTTTLYEIDRAAGGTFFISRSVSTTNICANMNQDDVKTSTGELVCADATADRFRIVDLDSMAVTFTGAVFTATCDNPSASSAGDGSYMMFACAVTDNLKTLVFGTDTGLHTQAIGADISGSFAIDVQYQTVMVERNSDLYYYTYDFGTGFASLGSYDLGASATVQDIRLDSAGDRFMVTESVSDSLQAFDSSNITQVELVWSISFQPSGGIDSNGVIYVVTVNKIMVSSGSSADRHYIVDLTGLQSGGGGGEAEPDPDSCADDEVAIDVESGTGVTVMCLPDSDNDGYPDFDPNDFPWSSGDPSETIPAFFQVFGFNEDAANLIAAIIIHIVVIFGTAGVFFFATHQNPPMFIWVALLVFGGGLSAAIGVMPLLYFFVEIALTVGAVAALVKTGVIGS